MLNLTQHAATTAQKGVVDLEGDDLATLKRLLTFECLPCRQGMEDRANRIVQLAEAYSPFQSEVMLGGAPFFMAPLEKAFLAAGYEVCYAFSVRDSIEVDGVKKSVFKHLGFVRQQQVVATGRRWDNEDRDGGVVGNYG